MEEGGSRSREWCLSFGVLITSFEKSKSCFIASPILSSSLGKSSGLGARLAYS
jgi:hypothetical protein